MMDQDHLLAICLVVVTVIAVQGTLDDAERTGSIVRHFDEQYHVRTVPELPDGTEELPVFRSQGIEVRYRDADPEDENQEVALPQEPPEGGNIGVYLADTNGDHRTDILTLGGHPTLWENTGEGFVRSNALPPIDLHQNRISYAHFFDHDQDGDDDLLLLAEDASPRLYENEDGRFRRADAGLRSVYLENPQTAASGDLDRDGCPDLYIGNYGTANKPFSGERWRYLAEHPSVRPDPSTGEQNLLLMGDCSRFRPAMDRFTRLEPGWTHATSIIDVDHDGWPEIHVANDFANDVLYQNDGGRLRYTDLGAATDRNAMTSEVGDVNGDGLPDLFVTNIFLRNSSAPRERETYTGSTRPFGNNLFINQGNGSFTDMADEYGVTAGGWGWGASLADLNNDGFEDLIHTTTIQFSVEEYPQQELYHPQLWAGSPEGFIRRSPSLHGFNATNGRGISQFDPDLDGDLDLALTQMKLDATERRHILNLYENPSDDGDSIQFILETAGMETGARLVLRTRNRTMYRFANSRADFMSQEPGLYHFGLDGAAPQELTVHWPDGSSTTYTDLSAGARYVLGRETVTERLEYR